MPFKYELYKICWDDICSDSGWASDVEFDRMSVSHCISIGFIYKRRQRLQNIICCNRVNKILYFTKALF